MIYFFQPHAETRYRFFSRNSFLFFFSQVISGQQFPKPKGSTAKGDVSVAIVVIDIVLSYFPATNCNVLCTVILHRWLIPLSQSKCLASLPIFHRKEQEPFLTMVDIFLDVTCVCLAHSTVIFNLFLGLSFFLQVITQSSTKRSSFTSIFLIWL